MRFQVLQIPGLDAPRVASILKLAKGLDVSAAELVALLAPNQRHQTPSGWTS